MVREGKDVTLLTYSRMRHHCQASKQLVEQGYDPELIDLISLKPFDLEAIKRSIAKTHRVVIVEECMKTGGIGAELIALITEHCFDELDAPICFPVRHPTPYNGKLENLTIIQPHQIVETVQQLAAGDPAAGWLAPSWRWPLGLRAAFLPLSLALICGAKPTHVVGQACR